MNDSRGTRLWVALFVGMVFVCGLSIGIALGPHLAAPDRDAFRTAPRGRGGPPERAGAFLSERILSLLDDDPTFTAEQRERLTELFSDRRDRFRQLNREMRRQFEAERERLREDISVILTPEQTETFERARRRDGRGRGFGTGTPRGR